MDGYKKENMNNPKPKRKVFWPEWKSLLLRIDGNDLTTFCYKERKTYAHAHNIVKELAVMGLISARKDGRRVIYTLTDRGTKLCETIYKAESIMRGDSEDNNDGDKQ